MLIFDLHEQGFEALGSELLRAKGAREGPARIDLRIKVYQKAACQRRRFKSHGRSRERPKTALIDRSRGLTSRLCAFSRS